MVEESMTLISSDEEDVTPPSTGKAATAADKSPKGKAAVAAKRRRVEEAVDRSDKQKKAKSSEGPSHTAARMLREWGG